MPKLAALIHIARQGTGHHAAHPGADTLQCTGSNQRTQAVSGHRNQGRDHKNGHTDEDHRAATDAVRERAVEQLRHAIGQQIGGHYALDGPFTYLQRLRHVCNRRDINGLRHLTDGDQQDQH
ncbi:hypothetical protein D3C75_526820 [compost metagenome]